MNNDVTDILDAAIDEFQAYLNTGMPGKAISWNAEQQTVVVRPMIRFLEKDGTVITMPDLPDVLVQYPGGGGLVLTFPIEEGDECFITFSQSCIDSWWDTGDVGEMLSTRKHDLSDGFAFFGFTSRDQAVPNVDTDAIAVRTKNGSAFLKVYQSGLVEIDGTKLVIKCPAELEQTQVVKGATTFKSTTRTEGKATAVAGMSVNGIEFTTHKHGNVQPGSGQSGGPIS